MIRVRPARRSVLKGIGALAIVTATGPRAFAGPIRWDFTIYYGPGHAYTRLYTRFAEEVGKRTNGELDITVRTAGEMPFSATEAVTVAGQGQVAMALGYQGFIAGTTKIAAMPGLPFLMRNREETLKGMEVLLPYVEAAVGRFGARVLMWNGENWPQNLYGRGTPMTKLEDLDNQSARGSSPEQSDVIRHFGGAPVTLTTPEVPEAMNRGVIDAVFTGAANITGSKWTEFLDWGYICDLHGAPEYTLVNAEMYDELPEDMRGILEATVAEIRPAMADALKAANDESLSTLREELEIVDASAEDIKRYESDFVGYWENWAKDAGPDGAEALARIRDALGK
ncbi:hypothetical protein DLJ53_13835 [Acuticoccus sediminis]|uniref:TRAP-type C4-dicarboxylate transport system substrate-binding protein n=1 Tax=Acuticoccus sediminis TaxID=2184697 RepID=A0A8B2NTZ0_9HYPH|nr:TRAP transporter substrate-binding protein DctP [Acuticoccus sediminis]RAI02431.1 hypothetical protein DLJ53_13835 [Acuticoccus sediminis]